MTKQATKHGGHGPHARGAIHALHGVVTARVTDVVDPEEQGRVRVELPWAPDPEGEHYEAWARVATLQAGHQYGTWFMPHVDDEVLVAFEMGDATRPIVVGSLWNGQAAPPEGMDSAGDNERQAIRTRSGIRILLDGAESAERVVIETPGGQRVTLRDDQRRVEIEDANGNAVHLGATGIEIRTASTVTLQAAKVEVSAGMLDVDAGMAKFSGVVQAETVITKTIVASTYTPGAGNIW